VDAGGKRVREVMQREGRLVRNDALAVRPESGDGQLFVLTHREVNEPVHPPQGPREAPRVKVVRHQLWRVTDRGRLLGGEVPLLCLRHLEETVPVRVYDLLLGRHEQNLSQTLFSCKMPPP
jgi:hypothetical protein